MSFEKLDFNTDTFYKIKDLVGCNDQKHYDKTLCLGIKACGGVLVVEDKDRCKPISAKYGISVVYIGSTIKGSGPFHLCHALQVKLNEYYSSKRDESSTIMYKQNELIISMKNNLNIIKDSMDKSDDLIKKLEDRIKLNDEIKKELDYQLKDALYKDNVINELSKQVLDLEYKLNHSLFKRIIKYFSRKF